MSTRITSADFVRESNLIEGILREPTLEEIAEHERFMELPKIKLEDLKHFVSVYQPDALLRDRSGMNIYVGGHLPPAGGSDIRLRLDRILTDANASQDSNYAAYVLHHDYETLHPFEDGNGRSGRALWCWIMGAEAAYSLSFLHRWYYQSLQYSRQPV